MSKISCRLIMEKDCVDVLVWRNNPVTRTMSLSSELISETEHKKWFRMMMDSETKIGIIGEVNKSKIGVVFFSVHGCYALISINLNPLFRGKNLAVILLKEAIRTMQQMQAQVKYYTAEIKNSNIPSIKVFVRNGFILEHQKDDFSVYCLVSKFQE